MAKSYLERLTNKEKPNLVKRTFAVDADDYADAKANLKKKGVKVQAALALFFKDLASKKAG
jgi:type IV secretory pathway VirB9-like protein